MVTQHTTTSCSSVPTVLTLVRIACSSLRFACCHHHCCCCCCCSHCCCYISNVLLFLHVSISQVPRNPQVQRKARNDLAAIRWEAQAIGMAHLPAVDWWKLNEHPRYAKNILELPQSFLLKKKNDNSVSMCKIKLPCHIIPQIGNSPHPHDWRADRCCEALRSARLAGEWDDPELLQPPALVKTVLGLRSWLLVMKQQVAGYSLGGWIFCPGDILYKPYITTYNLCFLLQKQLEKQPLLGAPTKWSWEKNNNPRPDATGCNEPPKKKKKKNQGADRTPFGCACVGSKALTACPGLQS